MKYAHIEGYQNANGGSGFDETYGAFDLDEDDLILIAMLADPILGPELFWDDPNNHDYGGCYRVRDHQYGMFRGDPNPDNFKDRNNEGWACARAVGKTESIKGRSWTHPFRRHGQNLLVTAPELIHLLPLTDAIEGRIRDVRITREFLDTRAGKTGFTHRPFGVDFLDGTKIVGRIPRLQGTGVKGQHQPDLIMDEGQDYPERGWTEIHETVMRETRDMDGDPDYHFLFYGVHSGERDSGFFKRAANTGVGEVWTIHTITKLQTPDWSKQEKAEAIAAYGSTSSPDYRRNILGEAGAAASAFFVAARLMACVDQNRESDYNTYGYVKQVLRSEELDHYGMTIGEMLDIPSDVNEPWAGMDVGLTLAPSVIVIVDRTKVGKHYRLVLRRRYVLERFRSRTQREALYAIYRGLNGKLKGIGIDSTGLGFPFFQEIEDDENAPPGLLDVARAYKFNENVPVGIDESAVTKLSNGQFRDQFGNQVKQEYDPLTGQDRYVLYMPMVEASTRYLREMVDRTEFLLPFDPELLRDMRGETQQRVQRIAGLKNKPNAFHDLDALRGFAQAYRTGDVEAILQAAPAPVHDFALDLSGGGYGL